FRIWQMRDYYEWYRLKIINQIAIFTDANKLKGIPSPYFLYAHINCPHVPFVVSESGGEIDNKYNTRTLQAQTHKELFLGQVKFINKKIIEIVHNLQSLKEKPVIIIISDHGHAFWNDLNPEDSEYASIPLRNFISVYFPDKNAQDYFYKNMTLVNLFPIIFNAYFNTDIKLSQDISYYYKDFSKYPNSYKIFY
nr:hypothetical protein [bacterium]